MTVNKLFFFLLNPRYSGDHFGGRGSGGHQRTEQ